MEEEKIIHKRFTTGSSPLIEELIKLGYEEGKLIGYGLDKTRTFTKGKKIVHTSFNKIVLFEKEKIYYQGLTIHDEMLKFFTNRSPTEIRNE